MKNSWIFGNLDDEYVVDDYIDMYLQVKSLSSKNETFYKQQEYLAYYQHCLKCLEMSFGFDINDLIKNLSSDNQLMIDFYVNKALSISTPTSGWQMYSIFFSQHRENLREIGIKTNKILYLYRKIIEEIIKQENTILKVQISRNEILSVGYNNQLIPKNEEYDDIW